MKILNLALGIALLHQLATAAQVTWTNGGGDFDSENTANWSPNTLPTSTDDVFVNTNDFIGNTSGSQWNIQSITFASSLSTSIETSLQTIGIGSGGITIQDNSTISFNLGTIFTANSSITIGAGSTLIFSTNTFIETARSVTANLQSGAILSLNFVVSPWEGSMNITGDVTSSSILITGGDLDQNTLSKLTINGQAVTINNGFLTAIPEPSTFAAFAGAAMLGLAVVRRRKRAV